MRQARHAAEKPQVLLSWQIDLSAASVDPTNEGAYDCPAVVRASVKKRATPLNADHFFSSVRFRRRLHATFAGQPYIWSFPFRGQAIPPSPLPSPYLGRTLTIRRLAANTVNAQSEDLQNPRFRGRSPKVSFQILHRELAVRSRAEKSESSVHDSLWRPNRPFRAAHVGSDGPHHDQSDTQLFRECPRESDARPGHRLWHVVLARNGPKAPLQRNRFPMPVAGLGYRESFSSGRMFSLFEHRRGRRETEHHDFTIFGGKRHRRRNRTSLEVPRPARHDA
jgi:hypothetical protein